MMVTPEVVGVALRVADDAVPVDETTVTMTYGATLNRPAVNVTAPDPVTVTVPDPIAYGTVEKFSFMVLARMSVPAVNTFFAVI